jgi:hypothetical protein
MRERERYIMIFIIAQNNATKSAFFLPTTEKPDKDRINVKNFVLRNQLASNDTLVKNLAYFRASLPRSRYRQKVY